MPIRIRMFLSLLAVSLGPIVLLCLMIPGFFVLLLSSAGIPILMALFTIVILVTLISLFVAVHFTLPLTELNEVARLASRGDLSKRAIISGEDEVAHLSASVNFMLDILQKEKNNLNEKVKVTTSQLARKVKDLEAGKKMMFDLLDDLKKERAQLSRSKLAMESAANGIVITDAKGIIEWVNPAFSKLTGYAFQEVLGRSTRLLHSGKQDKAFYQKLWETILSGRVWHGEIINRKKDGSLYTEEQTITPVKDQTGAITGFIGIKLDVTEKKRLEKEAEMAKTIIESSEDPILSKDLKGKILSWNKKAEMVYGYDKKEIVGKSVEILMSKGQKGEVEKILERIKNGQRVIDFETKRITKDGKILDVVVNISPIKKEGKIVGASVIYHDISEIKKSNRKLEIVNKELEESKKAMINIMEDLEQARAKTQVEKAKDEAMLASIGDGVIATDDKNLIILVDKAVEELLGFTTKELIGKDVLEILPIEDEKGNSIRREEHPLYKALSGSTTNGVYYYRRKDKTKFPAEIKVTPVILKNKIIGAIDVFSDITKEKEIDKAKTEFVSLASHQLRSPPGVINWSTELLLGDKNLKLNEEQRNLLTQIFSTNKRMIELIDSLLNTSRVDLGTFSIVPQPVDIEKTIKDILLDFQQVIVRKNLKIIQRYDSRFPIMNVDKNLLGIIMMNLISNAVKYTPEGGMISLSLIFAKEGLEFKISDTGYGIPKNQQSKIFSKLFRADNIQKLDSTGNGLGLYLVKSLITYIKGSISFESEENKGTTFRVIFPNAGMKRKEGTTTLHFIN